MWLGFVFCTTVGFVVWCMLRIAAESDRCEVMEDEVVKYSLLGQWWDGRVHCMSIPACDVVTFKRSVSWQANHGVISWQDAGEILDRLNRVIVHGYEGKAPGILTQSGKTIYIYVHDADEQLLALLRERAAYKAKSRL